MRCSSSSWQRPAAPAPTSTSTSTCSRASSMRSRRSSVHTESPRATMSSITSFKAPVTCTCCGSAASTSTASLRAAAVPSSGREADPSRAASDKIDIFLMDDDHSLPASSHHAHSRTRRKHHPRSTLGFVHTFLCALLLLFSFSSTKPAAAQSIGIFGPDQLFTSSVAYCSPPEVILVSSFGLRFFRDNRTLEFDIAAASVNNNVSATASVSVNAFGLGVFNVALDLCTIANGILCPIPTYNFNGGGVFPVPEQFASKIPSIAFKIPDLEAVATVQLIDQNQRVVACLQATLSNGHTTYQKAAIWGTAGLAALAAGSSFLHSAIPASLGAAQWRIVDVMAAIQHVAVVSLLSLTYPVAFSSYASNFAWSIGMINISPLQSSITSTRRATGGTQSAVFGNALEADGGRKYDPFIRRAAGARRALLSDWTPSAFGLNERGSISPASLVRRLAENDPAAPLRDISFNEHSAVTPLNSTFLSALPNRLLAVERIYAPNTGPNGQLLQASEGGPLPIVYPNTTSDEGIELFAERLDIHPANVFLTVLVNYMILFGFMFAALAVIYILARFFARTLSTPNWAERFIQWNQFGKSYITAFLGRFLLITFPILLIFAFFQWRFGDSWVPDMVAAVTIAVCVAGLAVFFVPMFYYARRDGKDELYYPEELPPAEAGKVPKIWGSFAHPWKPKFYWAYLIFLFWSVGRACFIGFAQHHGFVQAIGLLIFELVLFVLLCVLRPSRNKAGNAVTILLCLSRVISWAICVAFTHQADVQTIPRVIVGYVLLVATGIPILLLLLLTIIDLFEPLRPSKLRTIKRMNRLRTQREKREATERSEGSDGEAVPESPSTT